MDSSWAMQILSSADFWKIAFPALAAILAWYMNERAKLVWEQFKRKEESYTELIRCLRGFYSATQDRALKDEFIHQVNLCWLYAPDDVIRKAYQFLESVHTGSTKTPEQQEDSLRAFVHAIRNDLLSRKPLKKSDLSEKDFRHLRAK